MKSTVKGMVRLVALAAVSLPLLGQVVVREIDAPTDNATGLCWDGEALWVSGYTNTIWKVHPVTGAVMRTLTGPVNGSDGLAWENGYLWTISRVASDVHIYKIDTLNGAMAGQIPDPTGGWAGGLVWDGAAFWFSDYYPVDRILRVDTTTMDTLAMFAAPGNQPYGMAYDGESIWNSSEDTDADRIYRIDSATGRVLWSFALPAHQPAPGRRPRGLAWDGQYLWVLAYAVDSWEVKIFQYDISNAENPDIDFSYTNHDFGAHVVGFPVVWETDASNIGNVNLVLDSAHFFEGLAYNLLEPDAFPVTIIPGAARMFVIEFDPPEAGLFHDTLAVYSNDPDENPFLISLTGTGLADEGDINVIPSTINFGQVRIGNPVLSTSRTAQIWNIGTGVLTVSSVEVEGEGFSMDPIFVPVDIDSSSFVSTRVWFAPTEARQYEGTLRIVSDDPDESIFEVRLTGIGDDSPYEGGEIFWYFWAQGNWENGINSITWIPDMNGDGIADVLAASDNHLIYCVNGSSCGIGDTLWTYDTGADPMHSGVVWYERGMSVCPDLTGDGIDDVILGTSGGSRSVYALSGAEGEELWMFDTHYWGDGGWVYEVYPISDINGDFVADVLAAAGDDGNGTGPNKAFALSGADGELLWQGPASVAYFCVRTIADVTGDGIPDVVAGDTDGGVMGLDGASGAPIWQATVGLGSPVFVLVAMGNANPHQTETEDVAVASAYSGVYCLDGGNGARIWFTPLSQDPYEIAAGSDITGDDIQEVYAGTMTFGQGGHIICLDGASGSQIWSVVPDPNGAYNVLSMTMIPDINGDRVDDIVVGTLGDHIVLLDGWDGSRIWASYGQSPSDAVDAVGVLPDIDGNGSWEILAGNRSGVIQALSGGLELSAVPSHAASPEVFALKPNYPNPFNLSTTIPYELATDGHVTLAIYDLLGRRVTTLVSTIQAKGSHQVLWNGTDATGTTIASGVYFVQMRTEHFLATHKMMLLK
jgi:outer membrane protein assembly factor BamB